MRAFALVAALVLLASCGLTSQTRAEIDPAGELRERLAEIDESGRFEFLYQPLAAPVLECFVGRRQLLGRVDTDAAVLLMNDESGTEVLRRLGERTYLQGSLFADVDAAWVRIDGAPTPEGRRALVHTLGPDLAGYALADGLPASAAATVRAALDAADEVTTLQRDRYRLTVAGGELTGSPVVLEVGLGSDAVERIRVKPLGPDEDAQGGWTVTYVAPGPRLGGEEPASFVPFLDLALSDLEPSGERTEECELSI